MKTRTKIILGVSLAVLCLLAVTTALVVLRLRYHAFVIPTGAMAPGIRGQHFEFRCSNCGYEYAVGYRRASPSRPKAIASW